jgi:hypothetical protein
LKEDLIGYLQIAAGNKWINTPIDLFGPPINVNLFLMLVLLTYVIFYTVLFVWRPKQFVIGADIGAKQLDERFYNPFFIRYSFNAYFEAAIFAILVGEVEYFALMGWALIVALSQRSYGLSAYDSAPITQEDSKKTDSCDSSAKLARTPKKQSIAHLGHAIIGLVLTLLVWGHFLFYFGKAMSTVTDKVDSAAFIWVIAISWAIYQFFWVLGYFAYLFVKNISHRVFHIYWTAVQTLFLVVLTIVVSIYTKEEENAL